MIVAILKEGNMAPDFTLPDDGGTMFTLSHLRGNPVVIYFYPKDDTGGCTKEALDFSYLSPQFDALGIKVIGVSPDSIDKHKEFRNRHKLAVLLLSDQDKSVLKEYGVWVEKNMYGRKYMGVERTTVLIDATGKVSKIWSKVKIPGHAETVLNTVKITIKKQFMDLF